MATITVFESVTLDGVMQGFGRTDEDTRDGFEHGGWGQGYQDEVSMSFAAEGMNQEGGLLFGRRTYMDLLTYWTSRTEPNPFTDVLVNSRKFVASRASTTKLPFPNSTLLIGDVVDQVRELCRAEDMPLTILGSGELVRTLHSAGLVDEYVVQIHPIVLGSGSTLFGPADRADLILERCVPTTTGVIIAQYRVRR